MIVGVLLFTPLLLLLPTTLVYYVLAMGLHCGAYLTCQTLQLVIELLYLNPMFFAWCWAFRPGLVSGVPSVSATIVGPVCSAVLLSGCPALFFTFIVAFYRI